MNQQGVPYITVVPPNTAVLGRREKPAVLGGSKTLKNPIWDLKWAGELGGRRYWEGGGIGREAVLGGRRYWEGGGIGREAVLGGRRYWEGGGIGREAVLGGRRYWEGRLYESFPLPLLSAGGA